MNNPTGYAVAVLHNYTGVDILGGIGDSNDVAVLIAAVSVPEATSLALPLTASVAIAGWRRQALGSLND